ncbi:MAG: disulfide oxidoreductase [Candidatus Pacearchaeota archaeon]
MVSQEVISFVTNTLSLLTLLSTCYLIIFFFSLITKKKFQPLFINENILFFAFLVSLVATLGSLFFSEVAKYEPCKLCWFQRIFMYPQVIILGIALWKKEFLVRKYAIPLSVIGALIAGFHYLLQIRVLNLNLPCSTIGQSVSCSTLFVMKFGYITIPMMALISFLLIIIFLGFKEGKTYKGKI